MKFFLCSVGFNIQDTGLNTLFRIMKTGSDNQVLSRIKMLNGSRVE